MAGKENLLAVAFVTFDLPLTAVCIQSYKDARFAKRVHALVQARKLVKVSESHDTNHLKVYKKSERAALLRCKDD